MSEVPLYSTHVVSHSRLDTHHGDSAVAAERQNVCFFSGLNPPESWCSWGGAFAYRGTSLTRKRIPLGPYRRPMPRVLGGS